jgi:chromate reductase
MMTRLKILAISGSLSKKSLNTQVLHALRGLAPDSAVIELAAIDSIPFFNADLNEVPASVNALKQQIEASDGVLIATPEFNYGIPGVLKNAIDWVSRPAYASVLAQKPIGILGASPGPVGTARAQGQLKQVLSGTASDLFPFPELTIGQASNKFGQEGQVEDERLRASLTRFITSYCEWLERRIP